MSKFSDFYSKKSVEELLEKLRLARITPESIDKAWYDALIVHLKERELTTDEKKIFDHILYSDVDSLTDKKITQFLETETRKDESASLSGNDENSRYTALKSVSALISLLGYFVILVGIGLLFFMLSEDKGMMGFIALVVSIVISLPLLAYSNLIQVFIDIEQNTRKTRELLQIMRK